MKYNKEFLTIDTQEKAYFLGLAFGDGYNSYNSPFKFTMGSINTDYPLYSKLSIIFPFLKLKQYKSHSNMIYLESYLKNFCIDLNNLGLNSSKTKNDKIGIFYFPILPKELLSHFIRGYFDADGSAWYPTRFRSRNNLRIEFGCSTKNFLLEIKKILDDNDIHFTYSERSKKSSNGQYYTTYNLFSSNYETSLKFANFIYKDATLYLLYKYDKCYRKKDLKPNAFLLFGECPYCSSNKIVRKGIRDGKTRLLCNNCNKRFTRPMPN